MAKLPIQKLSAGMELSQDVKDQNGRLLLAAGTKIEEKHFRVFQVWGVRSADVKLDDDLVNEEDVIDESISAAEQAALEQLFRHTDREHPFMAKLFDICVQRRAIPKMEESNAA